MFSFHRPATGEAPPPGSMVPIEVAFQGQGFDFMRSPPKTDESREPTTPASAFASDSVDVRDEVEHQAEEGKEERRGTAQTSIRRRSRSDESSSHEADEPRGVWHLPNDPDGFTSDPFDARLFAAGRRFGDDGASDKDEIMSSADGRTTGISLHHLGLSGHTSSLDDAKVVDLEAAGMRRRRPAPPLEDSVYPEVQASVSNVDDPTACVLTLRVWFLGLLFCLVFAALNTYFSLRYPAPLITPIITQLFTYPFGRFLAKYMPAADLKLPIWTRRLGMPHRVSLNPGPFSIKEHALLVIMANVSTGPPLGLNYSVAAEKFYGQPQPFGFDILLVFTTQMIGFGAAGLCRRFLVWPASMLWPQNLVFCTLLNTFHAEIEDEEPGPSRLRFFTYVFCGAFCWFWLPGEYLLPFDRFSSTVLPLTGSCPTSQASSLSPSRPSPGFAGLRRVSLGLSRSDGRPRRAETRTTARQRRRQPTVWRLVRARDGLVLVRLEPDLLRGFTPYRALVGAAQHIWRLLCGILDHRADHVLHQCEWRESCLGEGGADPQRRDRPIRRSMRPISRYRPRPSLIASGNRTMPCAYSTLRVSRST